MKINEILQRATKILKENNVEYPKEDSFDILSFLTGKDKLNLIFDGNTEFEKNLEKKYMELIEMRKNKKPLQYIIGSTPFMGFNFKVCENVLIPRPDTEVLVEKVLNITRERSYKKIVDVCCGSGAIGISIAKLKENILVDLCDISEEAKKLTIGNIELLGTLESTKFYKSDLLNFAKKRKFKYDVVVSNPPYIKSQEIENLMDDVKNYEPRLALDGGEDGLEFYKRITKDSKEVLNKGGLLAFEIGHDQGSATGDILKENGFLDIEIIKDFGHNDRVVLGFLK